MRSSDLKAPDEENSPRIPGLPARGRELESGPIGPRPAVISGIARETNFGKGISEVPR